MNGMKKIFAVCFIMFGIVSAGFSQIAEKQLVQKAFKNYKNAILTDKGEEAVKYVDSRTIKYYDTILYHVKNADSATVSALSLLDRLMVFSIRHRVSKSDVQSFDGEKLLVYAIQNGMVGKNSVANNSIGDVTIVKNFAKGQFIANGKMAPFFFHFYKENGSWKIDLTSLFAISNMAFKNMIKESGEGENEFLFSLLDKLTGRTPGPEIWQPVQ